MESQPAHDTQEAGAAPTSGLCWQAGCRLGPEVPESEVFGTEDQAWRLDTEVGGLTEGTRHTHTPSHALGPTNATLPAWLPHRVKASQDPREVDRGGPVQDQEGRLETESREMKEGIRCTIPPERPRWPSTG